MLPIGGGDTTSEFHSLYGDGGYRPIHATSDIEFHGDYMSLVDMYSIASEAAHVTATGTEEEAAL